MKTTLLLVDDHEITVQGLKTIIETDSRYKIVGVAYTYKDGHRLARKLKPDVSLVDIRLPDGDGIQLTKEICNDTNVMIVSAHDKINYAVRAIRAGAKGYVIKGSKPDCIMRGIEAVAAGKQYIDDSLSEQWHKLEESLNVLPGEATKLVEKYGKLTEREQEVFHLLAENYSTMNIAEMLFISKNTVQIHYNSIMKKLGLKDKVELIQYAVKIGHIDTNDW
ncbi:MAG: response regulator transcription factor [Desulfobacterales bacterium]|nr:response regulator transcription factor [Desulfobacterales bacterium]